MQTKPDEIISKIQSHLDSSRYKIYEDSIKYFYDYVTINYQSKSVVDHNMPDDDMIYGIGILMYRMSDGKIFEIHCHSDIEEQIMNNLSK